MSIDKNTIVYSTDLWSSQSSTHYIKSNIYDKIELLTTQNFRLVEVEKGRSFFLNNFRLRLRFRLSTILNMSVEKKCKYEIAQNIV